MTFIPFYYKHIYVSRYVNVNVFVCNPQFDCLFLHFYVCVLHMFVWKDVCTNGWYLHPFCLFVSGQFKTFKCHQVVGLITIVLFSSFTSCCWSCFLFFILVSGIFALLAIFWQKFNAVALAAHIWSQFFANTTRDNFKLQWNI